MTDIARTPNISLMGDQDRVPHQNEALVANNLVSHFEGIEQLADPELRRDYLGHLSKEDFIQEIQAINGIIRGHTDGSLQTFDGDTVVLATHDVPRQEDKEALLGDIWTGVQEILTDPSLDADKALEYAGALTGLGILFIHPFDDSNGRTSRTMSRLIRGGTGEDFGPDLEKALGKDGSSYERLNNSIFRDYVNDAVPSYSSIRDDRDFSEVMRGLRSINYDADHSEGALELSDVAKNEGVIENFRKSNIPYYTMVTFLKNVDREGYDQVKTHIRDGVLEFGQALDELAQSDRGIEYMSQLRDADRYVRSLFIKRFVETMTSGATAKLQPHEEKTIERSVAKEEATSAPERFGKFLLDHIVERSDGLREVPVRDLILASNQAYKKQK